MKKYKKRAITPNAGQHVHIIHGKRTRFSNLSHLHAAEAKTGLQIYTVSQEHSLLVYTQFGSKGRLG